MGWLILVLGLGLPRAWDAEVDVDADVEVDVEGAIVLCLFKAVVVEEALEPALRFICAVISARRLFLQC